MEEQEQELKWPVDTCPGCGYDLTKLQPRPRDKTGLSDDGLKTKMFTDYCPQCGMGQQVGIVPLIAPKEMTQVKEPVEIPSPDKETGEDETKKVAAVEPRTPGPGEFWCTKCACIHKETSKVGKNHSKKYREA